MVITSVLNNKIVLYSKLKNTKERQIQNKFLVEGMHLIQESYKNGVLLEVFVLEGKSVENINVPITYVTSNVLNKLSSLTNSNSIIGVCKIVNNDKIRGNKILLLDNIQDPGNLGTIIRSSLAFNVDTLVISKNSVDLYNDKVIRATQGMLFKLNIVINDLDKIILDLKENGYEIIGTDVNNGVDIREIKNEKYALIMGNEGQGISNDIKKLCNKFVYIKTNDEVESLNVSIATSILLYELNRGLNE